MTSFALVLAALATAAPKPSPLQGCEAQHGKTGWMYVCDGLSAGVVEQPGDDNDPKEMLDAVVKDYVDTYGATEQRTEPHRLGGKDSQMVFLAAGDATFVVAVLARKEGLAGYVCHAEGDGKACVPVLEALAAQPWGQRAPGTIEAKGKD